MYFHPNTVIIAIDTCLQKFLGISFTRKSQRMRTQVLYKIVRNVDLQHWVYYRLKNSKQVRMQIH